MANIGCRIYPEFERPRPELVEAFRGMPVANIDDCMNRTAAMRPEIRRLGTSDETMLGTAFTVKVAEGDNLMFHKAMDMAQPGDVIVIDAGGVIERSILGALMANYCKVRGIRGIIVDGSVRDCTELANMKDFAVYAKAVSPNGPYKNGPGELRGVISLGGIVVHPGDIVVGDADGVVFIRPQEAQELANLTKEVMQKENKIMRDILEKAAFVRPWVDEKLKEIGCETL